MAEGFVYVSDADPGPMASAAAGVRVATASAEPPWIVVDHAPEGALVAHWPGRLFRVVVVAPRTKAEGALLARAARGLAPTAGYTPAVAVDVVEELPAALVFGPHGAALVAVVDVACALTADVAARLASVRPPGGGAAYSRAWARWLAAEPDRVPGQDARRAGAPVGAGFMVVDQAVRDSARRRGAPDAITFDAEQEMVLAAPWSAAIPPLLYAAMAFGAPDLVSAADAAVLTAAWRAVIGTDPAGRLPA